MSFIIIWPERAGETLLWVQRFDGARMWMGSGVLYGKEGVPPESIKLMHFAEREAAEREAFQITVYNKDMIGRIAVVECDKSQCLRCRGLR